MANVQLPDFITAENELDGNEPVYIAQIGKTRKTTLQKIKDFILGTATLTTNDKTVKGAINEVSSSLSDLANNKANNIDNNRNTSAKDVTGSINELLSNINNITNTGLSNTNGWFKDKKTGLIFQWVSTVGVAMGAGSSYSATISFPIAFPNACLKALASPDGTGSNANGLNGYTANAVANTVIAVWVNNTGNTQTFKINVFAIGY